MTTGKTIALIIWTFVGKGIALLFNMLSRSKYLLILPPAMILEPKHIKSLTVSTLAPSVCR